MTPIDERYPILRLFAYSHLPERLQEISKLFYELAWKVVHTEPHNSEGHWTSSMEIQAALRKLLEAKDCAVRAAL